MVATETRRVYWTDGDYRTAVERFMEQRLWSVQRLAADMAVTVDQLNTWLDGDVASTKLRQRLVRLVDGWQIPHPRAHDEETDGPSASTVIGPFDYLKGAADAPTPEPVQRTTLSPHTEVDDIPAPTEDRPVSGEFINLSPLPFGFAMLVPPEVTGRGHPAAIILRSDSVAITKALRKELDGAGHLLIGVESRTDVPESESGMAISVVTDDSQFFDYALRVPKNHEWASTVRKSIPLPNGIYRAELIDGTRIWVCRRQAD